MIKKIILISFGILILLGGGLTAYVATMDWNAHKDKIANEISNMIGEKVEFTGNLDVSLLPHPHMYATDINIINPITSEKLAVVKKMETVVSLRSILRKTPDIQSLALSDVEFWIKIDDNGKTNWHQESESQLVNADLDSRLQSFSLQKSTLHLIYDKYDINADLTDFNADIQAISLAGPYRLDGNFKKNDDNFGLALSISSFSLKEDIDLNFVIMHPRSKSYLRYDGKYNLQTDYYEGDFSGNSEHTADFVNILLNKNALDEKYNKSLLFSVAAKSSAEALDLSHLVVKFDRFIEGAGDITIPYGSAQKDGKTEEIEEDDEEQEEIVTSKPKINIKYQLVSLDLRPIIAVLKAKFSDYQNDKLYEPKTEYDAEFDITAEHVNASDMSTGFFENMSAKGVWQNNVLSLDDFYAVGQGNTVWTMTGSLSEENSAPHYFAKVVLEGQNFLSLINSFDDTFTAPTQNSYRNGKLSFEVYGDAKNAKLSNIDLALDKMNMSAEAEVGLDHKFYDIKMSTDKINFDNYITRNMEINGIKDILIDDSRRLAWLKDAQLKVRFETGNMTFRAVPVKNVVLEFHAQNDTIQITQAQFEDVVGSDIKFSGTVKGIGSENLSVENAEYQISAINLKDMLNKMEIPYPDWNLLNQTNISSSGTISGNFEKAEVDFKNKVEDVQWDYKGQIFSEEGRPTFDGYTEVKTHDFETFLSLLGANVSDKNSLKSVFNGKGKIAGNKKHWSIKEVDSQLGYSKFTGNIDVKQDKKKYIINANVTTNEFNLDSVTNIQSSKTGQRKENLFDDAFITRPILNRDVISYDVYRDYDFDVILNADKVVYKNKNFNALSVHAKNAQNNLQLQDLKFQYDGADYQGNVQINYAEEARIKGSMDISGISLADVGGKIYRFNSGTLHLNSDFESSANSFEDMIYGLSGTLAFDIGVFTMQGLNFTSISDDLATREYSKGVFQMVHDNLQSGSTVFDSFTGDADMKDGTITFKTANLKNEDVDLTLTGGFSLSAWKMNTDTSVKYIKVENIPEFSFSLTDMINKPVLGVSVENIVKKYDSHWEKVEQEKQAKLEEELKQLREKMTNAQKKTISVADKVSEAMPVIEQYSQKTTSQATLAQYQGKIEKLKKIAQSVDNMQVLSRQTDYTLDDVHQIEEKCPAFISEIDDILADVKNIYLEDIKNRFVDAQDMAVHIDANNKKLMADYEQMREDNFQELLKIEASQYFINSAELRMQKGEMDNYSNTLTDKYNNFKNKAELSKTYISTEEQEVALVDLQQRLKEMQDIYEKMEKVRSKSADLLLNMINERRVIFETEQAKKEAKRKKEQAENADNLLASSISLEENVHSDSKPSEPENDNKEVPISGIIASQEKPTETAQPVDQARGVLKAITESNTTGEKVSGTITKSYDDTKTVRPTAGGGYLKPIEGDVQKTTGTITIK